MAIKFTFIFLNLAKVNVLFAKYAEEWGRGVHRFRKYSERKTIFFFDPFPYEKWMPPISPRGETIWPAQVNASLTILRVISIRGRRSLNKASVSKRTYVERLLVDVLQPEE